MKQWNYIVLAVLGGGFVLVLAAQLLGRLTRGRAEVGLRPEELLLEEAIITAALAPGMTGQARLPKHGASAEIRVRATDGSQAFPRGARVRIIDYHENCYLIESADEEHLVH